MSTTFAVINREVDGHCDKSDRGAEKIEVAHRRGAGGGKVAITWLNPLAKIMPDDTPVEPLDNSPQGVDTIGDLKKLKEEGF